MVEGFRGAQVEVDFANSAFYAAIETALLFNIAGFDANAATVISGLRDQIEVLQSEPMQITQWAAKIVMGLCSGDPGVREIPPLPLPDSPLTNRAKGAVWAEIGSAIQQYFRWLCLELDDGNDTAKQSLKRVRMLLRTHNALLHADAFHVAQLVEECIAATAQRALRTVGPMSDPWYRSYVDSRARGALGNRARPFFWPSTKEYVTKCLPGPHSSAVIRVPTGSGKSFIVELAIANAVTEGWVLYLVPTNALAAQVRSDLKNAFKAAGDVDVRAFLGGEEYTTLPEEHVSTTLANRTIAVMTPEKCALALRLSAPAFQNCRLCVFDECHLIGEGSRGALAELVVGHLLTVAPACRFLFMSAMLANPDEIAKWLQEVSSHPAVSIDEDWRPTRSLRAIVGVDLEVARARATAAFNELKGLSERRKNRRFLAPHAFVASLQGAWDSSNGADYALMGMPTATVLEVNRAADVKGVSWVDDTAATVTEHFAKSGESVLTFLPGKFVRNFSRGIWRTHDFASRIA